VIKHFKIIDWKRKFHTTDESLNVVFTSYGTSSPSSDTLSKAGYTNVHIVPEQAVQTAIFQL
jgi:hypothetical protein